MKPICARRIALSLASLCLASLSNPGMPLPGLAWVAWVPLFIALDGLPPRRQALLFGVWGLLWWCWSIEWLIPAAMQFIGLAPWLASTAVLLVCALLSVPYALVGFCWRGPRLDRWSLAVWRALLVACLVGSLPSVLPASLVSGQYVYPHLIQIVDLGGVPLLLFAMTLCNAWLAEACREAPPRVRITAVIAALAMPFALWSYGAMRLEQIDRLPTTRIDIGWVQPNLQRIDSIDRLLEQTRALAAKERLDLIVWPEIPPAFSWSDSPRDRAAVTALLHDIGTPLLVNSGYVFAPETEAMRERGGPRPYYNAVQLLAGSGELISSYHKQRLVPFFEYLPYEDRVLTLRHYFPDSLAYVAGGNSEPLPFAPHGVIAPLICYEMIFPALARRQVEAGATLFVNPGNDGWFGASRGSISHLALAWFRTVEQRRPWLRVSNSGIGIAVDAGGRPLMTPTPLLQSAVGQVQLSIPEIRSFYGAYPHAFTAAALVLLLAGWSIGPLRARAIRISTSIRGRQS